MIKNIIAFEINIKKIIGEIDEVLNNDQLITNYKNLSLKFNEIWNKSRQLLILSYEGSGNEYLTKFENQTYEIPINDIFSGDTTLNRAMLFHRKEQFTTAKALLEQFLNTILYAHSINSDLPSEATEEGLYFKGEYFNAIFKLDSLLSKVSKDIKLVDNYINLDLIHFLLGQRAGITLSILTTQNSLNSLLLGLRTIQKHNNILEIRESQAFHDRFLILDDIDFYHFGASLKDLGNKTFMFSRINEQSIIKAITTEFTNVWNSANVLFV